MIAFEGLSKQYGTFEAVKPLTLQVSKGEVFGFLGPNGAGNTTTIRMLMGILVPSAGRVLVESEDLQYRNLSSDGNSVNVPIRCKK